MGASKERQKRIEAKESIAANLSKKELETKKKNKKFKIIGSIVVVVLVLCIALIAVVKSDAFYRNTTAVEINGVKYSITEYNYFYKEQYATYSNYFGDNLNGIMDSDALKDTTISKMKDITMCYQEALENGITLSEDDELYIDTTINNYKSYAMLYDYSTEDYLEKTYGKGITEEILRERLEVAQLVNNYTKWKYDSFEYDKDEIASLYNPDEDDKIDYRIFTFSVSSDSENANAEMDRYREQANEFAGKITDQDSFAELCIEYASDTLLTTYLNNPEASLKHTSIKNLEEAYAQWLTDSSRKEGDITVVEGDTDCYVLYYVGYDDNEYNVVSARVIPVNMEAVNSSDYPNTEEYQEAYEESMKSAKTNADSIYEEWTSGEATEESFYQLAKAYGDNYSDDGYGLYKNINRNKYTEEIDEWLFDPARKAGDTAVIGSYNAYYILYFNEVRDVTYREYLIDSELRSADFKAWQEESVEGYEAVQTWALRFAG